MNLYRLILLLLLGIVQANVKAQSCSMMVSDSVLCEGTTINFSTNLTGGTAVSYSWNFGNGFTANTSSPSHTYSIPGNYTPTVTITLAGGGTCVATGPLMKVFARPIANFKITTEDTMCFKGNNLCIQDLSTIGPSNAPLKKRIFQLSNGYIQVDNAPFSNTICYNNTVDVAGHLYSLVVEVSDTNNCVSRLQKLDSVLLYPKMPDILFTADIPPTCFTTNVTFTNHTAIPLTRVKLFEWDFGDGTKNSTDWTGLKHLYTGTGISVPKFMLQDTDGCTDSVILNDFIRNVIPDSTIYSSSFTQCFDNNSFVFVSKNNAGTTFWTVYDSNNDTVVSTVRDSLIHSFATCGIYRLNMTVYFSNCTIETDTIVRVYGPKAVIHEPDVVGHKVLNSNQCEIFDTVYFKTPVPYLSCSSGFGPQQHLWDFGDPFAPPCTTDTKNGISVGLNCNFSKDSMNVKHRYTPGQENCYSAKLFIVDPATGCSHQDSITLALTPPDAGPDTNAVPPRRGLFPLGLFCLGSTIVFNFYETLPVCAYEKAWINVDSACGKDNFVFADSVGLRLYNYAYSETCSPDGWVTVGLIIKNGNDANGNPCYDTAWYHHLFQLKPIAPLFTVDMVPTCMPQQLTVKPVDSIQYDMSKVTWYFSGGIPGSVTQNLGPTDSVILKQTNTYMTPGAYLVSVLYTNNLGCKLSSTKAIEMGYKPQVFIPKKVVCLSDSVEFYEYVRYYKYGPADSLGADPYWSDPARAAANKEKVWWDFGDGKGFSSSLPHAKTKYDQVGKYTIRFVAQDSLGCLDTLVFVNEITVVDPKAQIDSLVSSYYCAPQIVVFRDSSLIIDNVGSTTTSSVDAVVDWKWDFGDGTPISIFKNPAHNFTTNGVFTTKLQITTAAGCVATDSTVVDLKGPRPSFTISDTLGCEPFKTTFINTTGGSLKSWTWYFGDSANQTLTTLADSSVTFIYKKAGVYDVKLLGTDNVFNPNTGNTIICNSFFPDQITGLPVRRIYVMGTPPMDIAAEDSICPNEPIEFIAAGDTVYNAYAWHFGDGDSTFERRPDTTTTHTFKSSGMYTVMMIPTHRSGYECIDTAYKSIVAISVEPEFTIDSSKAPNYTFINQSQSAVRYEWNFGKPDAGGANTSTSTDGAFSYLDTGTFIICLTAYNKEDCWDSICKPIRIDKTRIIIPNVFTPDNNDSKNDAFDIDILGYTKYELVIYNRWGAKVFEGDKDGIGNDGINWNGKDHNEGQHCPAGVYYFIFTYQLITDPRPTTVTGTVTLIRDAK